MRKIILAVLVLIVCGGSLVAQEEVLHGGSKKVWMTTNDDFTEYYIFAAPGTNGQAVGASKLTRSMDDSYIANAFRYVVADNKLFLSLAKEVFKIGDNRVETDSTRRIYYSIYTGTLNGEPFLKIDGKYYFEIDLDSMENYEGVLD